MEIAAIALSVFALVLGVVNAISSAKRNRRGDDAAVTGDLYPILRTIREAAWQYAKPLGGGGSEHLVSLHYALLDLRDLRPSIDNKDLAQGVDRILTHPASGVPLGIDPPRFMAATMGPDYVALMHELATLADEIVRQCQGLRRGVH